MWQATIRTKRVARITKVEPGGGRWSQDICRNVVRDRSFNYRDVMKVNRVLVLVAWVAACSDDHKFLTLPDATVPMDAPASPVGRSCHNLLPNYDGTVEHLSVVLDCGSMGAPTGSDRAVLVNSGSGAQLGSNTCPNGMQDLERAFACARNDLDAFVPCTGKEMIVHQIIIGTAPIVCDVTAPN